MKLHKCHEVSLPALRICLTDQGWVEWADVGSHPHKWGRIPVYWSVPVGVEQVRERVAVDIALPELVELTRLMMSHYSSI
jgi:hypothetical protein